MALVYYLMLWDTGWDTTALRQLEIELQQQVLGLEGVGGLWGFFFSDCRFIWEIEQLLFVNMPHGKVCLLQIWAKFQLPVVHCMPQIVVFLLFSFFSERWVFVIKKCVKIKIHNERKSWLNYSCKYIWVSRLLGFD